MNRLRLPLPAALALVCACARTGAAPRAPDPGALRHADVCLDDRALELVRRTNAERTRRGLPALEPDARLQEAAQRHAADMARGDFMAHEGSDRALVGDRAERAGYRWTTVAENVAAGYPDPAAAVAGWMRSAGHRTNILDPGARHLGVGYAYRVDTRLHSYWVQVFGDTEGVRSVAAPC